MKKVRERRKDTYLFRRRRRRRWAFRPRGHCRREREREREKRRRVCGDKTTSKEGGSEKAVEEAGKKICGSVWGDAPSADVISTLHLSCSDPETKICFFLLLLY